MAKANALATNTPRFLHKYNGVYWLEREAPAVVCAIPRAGSDYIVVWAGGSYNIYDPDKGVTTHGHSDRRRDKASKGTR
jgi:hypothetical protein